MRAVAHAPTDEMAHDLGFEIRQNVDASRWQVFQRDATAASREVYTARTRAEADAWLNGFAYCFGRG